MVASTKMQTTAWKEVGKRFAALEADLRRRLDELGSDAATERVSVERALQSLVSSIDQGLDAVGAAVRDVELRQDVGEVVTSVRDAIMATFAEPGRRLTAVGKTVPKKAPAAKTRPASKPAARKEAVKRPTRPSTKGKVVV